MKETHRKLLSTQLTASSLLETITASVIFMIIFVMTMDTLTHLMTFDSKSADYIIIENELRKCKRQICLHEVRPEVKNIKYNWGEINIRISCYSENLFQVDMTAKTINKQHQISYRFLKAN